MSVEMAITGGRKYGNSGESDGTNGKMQRKMETQINAIHNGRNTLNGRVRCVCAVESGGGGGGGES